MEEEIDKANDAIEDFKGTGFLQGDHTEELDAYPEEGLYTIKWTVDSIDWKDSMTANIIDRVTGRTRSILS